ncbi:hypothetical protein [Marmoricola sp. RAF53]|uniref:hypothetical protein n=1 Tax=Marmoricola sp. RAF53 TaxID=3233059 RepID=UPI003F943C2F
MIGRPRALVMLPLVLLLEAIAALSHGAEWRGEWNWTLDYAVGAVILTGPFLAGVAAWGAMRERERRDLNDSTVRGWLVPARVAGGAVVVGLLGWAIGLVAMLVATATVTHGGPFTGWVALAVPCLLACYAAIGAAVGHLLPHRVVVVLVPVVVFALGAFSLGGLGPDVLRIGLTSGTLAGLTWDPLVLAAKAAVLVGVAVVLLATVAARRLWRRRYVAGAVVVAGALLLGGYVVLEQRGTYGFVYSDERASVCAATRPRVCVPPSNRRALEPASKALARAAVPLDKIGVALADTYVSETPGAPARKNDGQFSLGPQANRTSFPDLWAAQELTRFAAPCRAWAGGAPPQAYDASNAIATWVLRQQGHDVPGFRAETDVWLRTASAADQARWILRTFAQLRACELDAIVLPWQSGT